MRTNPDFILREIAGECILVPCGNLSQNINGLINLNDTAAYIWKQIDTTSNIEEIVQNVMEQFDVDQKTAEQDVTGLIKELFQVGMVLE